MHEITLNGTPIDPATGHAAGRIALPGLAARNELRVVADCAYTHDSAGMHRAVDSADGRVYTPPSSSRPTPAASTRTSSSPT